MFTLEQDNLNQILSEHNKVVVQFSAGWCGNCRLMKPKFQRLSDEVKDVAFVLVDAEKFPQARKLAEVDNLPTFAAYKDGTLKNQGQTNVEARLRSLVEELSENG